jgi:hypothetical protein
VRSGVGFDVRATGIVWFVAAAAVFAVCSHQRAAGRARGDRRGHPLAHVLALVRYGLVDPSSAGLHDIWGMDDTTAMAALS